MRNFGSPFTLCLFDPSDVSRAEFDKALKIYRDTTSPLLRTQSNQIRAKAASPRTAAGDFFFAGLLRSKNVIGFAMFGYYPSKRLVVVDHMAIDAGSRGENAFYAFAQLLRDAVDKLNFEIDFVVVEIEKGAVFGGEQTGGTRLVRLLSHIGFGEVHSDYRIVDLAPSQTAEGHPGVLMIRAAEKIHRIRKADLLDIHKGILFDHYLPWCRDFLGDRTDEYSSYLSKIHADYAERLDEVVLVNGPEEDGLIATPPREGKIDLNTTRHLMGYAAMVASTTLMAFILKFDATQTSSLLVTILAVYAGIDLVGRGKAGEVFAQTISALPGIRKSHYRQKNRTRVTSKRFDQKMLDGSKD